MAYQGGGYSRSLSLHELNICFPALMTSFVIPTSIQPTSGLRFPSSLMLIPESFAGSTLKVRVLISTSPLFVCFSDPGRSKGSYSPHLRRQEADLRVFLEDETLVLDPHMDYRAVPGLSSEVRERLFTVRPTSIVSNSSTAVQTQIVH